MGGARSISEDWELSCPGASSLTMGCPRLGTGTCKLPDLCLLGKAAPNFWGQHSEKSQGHETLATETWETAMGWENRWKDLKSRDGHHYHSTKFSINYCILPSFSPILSGKSNLPQQVLVWLACWGWVITLNSTYMVIWFCPWLLCELYLNRGCEWSTDCLIIVLHMYAKCVDCIHKDT
jgi:hypothetical protein